MRGLLGADEASGALALGETVRVGQTLRFSVRDRVLSRRRPQADTH
jgi:small ligand-binding sensory domain FIST